MFQEDEECTEEEVEEELSPLTVQLAYVLGRLGRHGEAQELYDTVRAPLEGPRVGGGEQRARWAAAQHLHCTARGLGAAALSPCLSLSPLFPGVARSVCCVAGRGGDDCVRLSLMLMHPDVASAFA